MEILWFFIIGAIAEFVDGTMGMAYGVINNSFLLSLGVVPALASACIHSAEVFTTFASGVSHLKLGNVDKKLFFNLVIPGCIFGGIGAALLSSFDFGRSIKPFVSVYLVIMGCVILIRSFKKNLVLRRVNAKALASVGGLFDAIGGGGWGPVVTSTLVANGNDPVKTIGSVNLAEFFVTVTESIVFASLLGIPRPDIVVALVLSGVAVAPVSAYVCKKIPKYKLMVIIGILIIVINIRSLIFT